MNKLDDAVQNIHYFDQLGRMDKWINHLHPLAKLFVTISYICFVVSFEKYNLVGLLGMCIYLIISMMVGDLPVGKSLRQVKVVLLLVCMVGIANPFFDRSPCTTIGTFVITGGMISMVTLMLKGIFAVLASYILIATTTIENICYSLRKLHVPKTFVTVILLLYRYIIVLLKETNRMIQAYQMRAPRQKGIHIKAWGSLVGLLLLRSIDRAQNVYESMMLRGFHGDIQPTATVKSTSQSIIYAAVWFLLFLIFRLIPVFEVVGNFIV